MVSVATTPASGSLPLRELPRHPVTAGIALLAIGTTIAWLAGWDIAALTIDVRATWSEPWRVLTCALPHVGVVHLAFNVYWLWRFGARIEARFGHLLTLAAMVVLAATSALAEYAVLDGGVGLSGVGYGLLGMLVVLRRHEPSLRDTVDARILGLFAIWFGVCVLTTLTEVMMVANVAHAVGFVVGLLVGAALAGRTRPRIAATAGLLVAIAACVAAATIGRPAINQSPNAGQTSAWLGYRALQDDDPARAVAHYRRALALNERAPWQYNFGLALWQTGDTEAAEAALQRAVALQPEPRYVEALAALRDERSAGSGALGGSAGP